MLKVKLLLIIVFFATVCSAGEESLISERPGQALTAFTLKEKAVQVQTGFNYRTIHYPNIFLSSIYSNSETTIRFGLGDRFELNSGLSYFLPNGYLATPNIGFRTRLSQNGNHIYSVQYTAYLGQFTNEIFSNSLTVLSHHQLSERVDFSFNGSLQYSEDELSESYVLSFGLSATPRIGLVIEHYGSIVNSDWDRFLDLGISYLITPKFQIDTYFGGGINDEVEDFFLNAGLTYRFDY